MDPVAMEKHKEEKKKIVLENIAAKCKDPSTPFQAMKDIGAALNNGAELKAKILTGGLANFSYMIYTTDGQNVNNKLFAKLSFPYAQIFPDKACPLMRTEKEYKMMKIFQGLAPDSVVSPYFCLDIHSTGGEEEQMKCLITEWSTLANEQYGNQFIDGTVDPRTAVRLAKSIAALHCSNVVEKDFNAAIRPFASTLNDIFKAVIDGWVSADTTESSNNAPMKLAQDLTKPKLDQMFANFQARVNDQEHLIHADFHVFNIMVGDKPAPETLERFAPEGNVVFCDWEFSHVGPAGRDLGLFEAFPLSCVIAHAVNGNPQCSNDIMTFIDRVWNEYGAQLKAHGKTDADVRHAYKDALVFCGFFMCAYSGLGIHMNFLPIDEETAAEDLEKAKESIGVIGLKAIMLGCGPDDTSDLSLEDFQAELKAAVEQEMALHDTADARRRSRRNRRSSALRTSGIRVSDGHLHLGSLDRTSIVEVNRRSSIMLNMGDLKLDEKAEMTESQ